MDQKKDQPKQPESRTTFRVEIAPGKVVTMQLPPKAVNRYSLIRLMARPDGTLIPAWESLGTLVRITRKLPARLNLDVDIATLHVLVRSGLVTGYKFTPSSTLIDLHSLVSHLAQCSVEDARDYWTLERRERYSDAYTSYHSEGMTGRPKNRKSAWTIKRARAASAKPSRPAHEPTAKTPQATRRVQPAPPSSLQQQQLDLFSDPQP